MSTYLDHLSPEDLVPSYQLDDDNAIDARNDEIALAEIAKRIATPDIVAVSVNDTLVSALAKICECAALTPAESIELQTIRVQFGIVRLARKHGFAKAAA